MESMSNNQLNISFEDFSTKIKEGKYGQARTKPVREIPQTKVEERATEEGKVSTNEVRATEESQRKIDDGVNYKLISLIKHNVDLKPGEIKGYVLILIIL